MIEYPAEDLRRQQEAILRAWKMGEKAVDQVSCAMSYADERGIDSHGIAMLPTYDGWRKAGQLLLSREPRVVMQREAVAAVDARHGLGHPAAALAIQVAINMAQQHGIGAVSVRRSNHFGAAGYYAHLASQAGMLGFAFSGTPNRTVVAPLAKEPRFGASPFAFAAPASNGKGPLIDMAVSTVAMGKINLARLAGEPIPEGWALDLEGRPVTNAEDAFKAKRLTPVGGHKGYGLGMMVETLASIMSASFVGGHDLETGQRGKFLNIGHFFLVIDGGWLHPNGSDEFLRQVGQFAELLRTAAPIDPEKPAMAPGDPERLTFEKRSRNGIPLLPRLVEEIRDLARGAGAEVSL